VLPDASTGQRPGSLAAKLSRCKEGMAHFLQVKVQSFLRAGAIAVQVLKGLVNYQNVTNVTKGHRRSVAVQVVSEPEIYHGAGFKLRAAAGVRV